FGGHLRVGHVRFRNVAALVEFEARDGREQHRIALFAARFGHELDEIFTVVLGRGVAVGIILGLVVVPELNKHVVARLQGIYDGLPAVFGQEGAGAAAILGAVVYR
nr:hypothetical protein [Tanacetum cinerariifolium]